MQAALKVLIALVALLAVAFGALKWKHATNQAHAGARGESQVALRDTPSVRPAGGVQVADTEYRYYSIRGSSVRELLTAMQTLGPTDSVGGSGRRYFGYTHWYVRYVFDTAPSGGQCAILSSRVQVTSTIDLPQWSNRDSASPELREKWDRYLAALRTHELGHLDNGIRFANEFAASIARVPPQPQCGAFNGLLKANFDSIVARYNQMDRDYDAATQHGRTQGAVLN